MKVDVEFAHIYLSPGGHDPADMPGLLASADYAAAVVRFLREQGHDVTTSALVDDYTYPGGDVDEALRVFDSLSLQPDTVWLEGSLEMSAEWLIGQLKAKFVRQRVTSRTFLADGRDLTDMLDSEKAVGLYDMIGDHGGAPDRLPAARFRFALNFDLDYTAETGARRYACPVLATCWHMHRLGALESDGIAPVRGDAGPPIDLAVSVLPTDYLQVEASCRALLYALGVRGRALLPRLHYVFE